MSATMGRETATVYRGGGRRWFSKNAAARAEARSVIRRRCECEEGDHITPGFPCHYHVDQEHYAELVNRFASRILRCFAAQEGRGNG
jgi:hypothetical protein